MVRIGCSGWNYAHWRGVVYPEDVPERRWLEHYAGKLGPVLWQLPPRFRRDDDVLADALASLPPGRHAFEFRDETWFAGAVYELLRRHDAALVVADRAPGGATPWVDTAGWAYLRFHHGRARRGAYGRDALHTWARRIAEARGDVYAYFNNDWEGFAVVNARTLARFLDSSATRRAA